MHQTYQKFVECWQLGVRKQQREREAIEEITQKNALGLELSTFSAWRNLYLRVFEKNRKKRLALGFRFRRLAGACFFQW